MKSFETNYDGFDKEEMKTLASCMNALSRAGYTAQFKIDEPGLESLETHKIYQPEEVKITNFFRFEGESDPGDSSILYAIETQNGEKGTLVDAYGTYDDAMVSEFVGAVEDIQKRQHGEKDE